MSMAAPSTGHDFPYTVFDDILPGFSMTAHYQFAIRFRLRYPLPVITDHDSPPGHVRKKRTARKKARSRR